MASLVKAHSEGHLDERLAFYAKPHAGQAAAQRNGCRRTAHLKDVFGLRVQSVLSVGRHSAVGMCDSASSWRGAAIPRTSLRPTVAKPSPEFDV